MPAVIKRSESRTNGMTLVELLVVVAVITLLSAITLPTMRTIMTQRKSSQASILVKNMLDAARARAIASGRPVAVVLERLSSRSERNLAYSGSGASEADFPLQSTTASNSDYVNNYAIYNTCIRMSLAESPPPVLFENISFVLDGNTLTLSGPAITGDPRISQVILPGSQLEFPFLPAMSRKLTVISAPPASPLVVTVDNVPAAPLLRTNVLYNNIALLRQTYYPTVPSQVSPATGATMSVETLPRPIPSQIADLPKGTCIDLSLSGLASTTRWNTDSLGTKQVVDRRDTRRHFASDWSYADTGVYPAPVSLRPIYIVFGPSGSVQSVLMNGIDTSGNIKNGIPNLSKYDVHDDLFLFVGRTDQIIQVDSAPAPDLIAMMQNGNPISSIAPDVLETQKIKANINDSSTQWVRISPTSGAISVATVTPVLEPQNVGLFSMPASSIGEVLARSRSISFTEEATAQ